MGNDDFLSPWGRLIQGTDGYYPVGLNPKIRIQFMSDDQETLQAFLADGTVLTFGRAEREGGFAGIKTPSGIYSWYLVEATNSKKQRTLYRYQLSDRNYVYLSDIQYGGTNYELQYRISFEYETLPHPFVDYRSSMRQELTQRVSSVRLDVKEGGAGYVRRFNYILKHFLAERDPSFYLQSIQKVFASGGKEPERKFEYHFIPEFLSKTSWTSVEKINPYLQLHGSSILYPEFGSRVDLESEGLTSIELPKKNFALLRQTAQDYVYEELSELGTGGDPSCRAFDGIHTAPRHLVRMRGVGSPVEVVKFFYDTQKDQTRVKVCSRQGKLVDSLTVSGNWALGPKTRLVDLDHDGRPDLIKVYGTKYKILRNLSDETHIEFASDPIVGSLSSNSLPEDEPKAIFIQDVNGDGLPDLIGKYSRGLRVWSGKGGHRFEQDYTFFPIVNTEGERITLKDEWDLLFENIHGNGIADLVIYGRNYIGVFVPDGAQFTQISIPALKNYFKNSWASPIVTPLLGDYLGSGNTQLTVTGQGRAYALEFSFPGAGLMREADDGRGNRLSFGYSRALPEAGIGSRPAVLSSLKIESAGKGIQEFNYQFQGAVTHSLNQMLLGFSKVFIEGNSNHLEAGFYHEDQIPTLPLSSVEYDLRHPEIQRITQKEYQLSHYAGLSFQKLKEEVEGWKDTKTGGSSLKHKVYQEYEDDLFCPSTVVETFRDTSITTKTHYYKPPLLTDHLGCWSQQILLSASHTNPAANFEQSLTIERDDLGHPTKLSTAGEEGRVLQQTTYRPDYRIQSIQVPGKGSTNFEYDSSYRLRAMKEPNGVTLSVDYTPSSDLISTFVTQHGLPSVRLHSFEQNFEYDDLDRLSKSWNSLYESSSSRPLETYLYQYAQEGKPGWISENLKFLKGDAFAEKEHWSFQSADGREMGAASPTDTGWVIHGLIYSIPHENRTQALAQKLSKDSKPSLTQEVLAVTSVLQDEIQSSLGYPLEKKSVVQTGVFGHVETTAAILSEELKLDHLENKSYRWLEHQSLLGKKTLHKDEEENKTSFQYDALGRLVEVILANQDKHQIKYDAQGRLKEIERSHIGKVTFAYHSGTDLVHWKKYFAEDKKLVRAVEFTYDAIGRVIRQEQLAYAQAGVSPESIADSHVYTFYYDGNTPSGARIEGQVGFLTSVKGPDFIRTQRYRTDGKLQQQSLQIPGWKVFTRTFEYQVDGSVKSNFQEFRNDPVYFVEKGIRVFQNNELDSLGRVSQWLVDQVPLASLSYNDYSQVNRVQLSEDTTLEFEFDDLTRKVLGFKVTGRGSHHQNHWQHNDRGLVESETFGASDQTLSRKYIYSRNGLLNEAADTLDTQKYQYDSTGLLNYFADKTDQSRIEASDKLWSLVPQGSGSPTPYLLDHLGRLSKKADSRIEYGPSGRIERLKKADKVFSYSYDETGKRLLKRENNVIVEAYFEDIVLSKEALYQPVRVGGITVGVLTAGISGNARMIPLALDYRGSRLEDQKGSLSVISPYGERKADRGAYSQVIDYVAQGYDSDLQAYRMEHRDYDPVLKRFHTPDPLFFENPEKCVESPVECNLYGYAKGNPVSFVDPSGKQAGDVWLYKSNGSGISNAIVWAEKNIAGVPGPYSHAGLEINDGRVYTATGAGSSVIQSLNEAVNFGGPRQIDVYSPVNSKNFNLDAAVRYAEAKTFEIPQMSAFSGHGAGQGANTYFSYGVCSEATQRGLHAGGLETGNYGFFTTPNDFARDSNFQYSHSLINGQKVETYGPAH